MPIAATLLSKQPHRRIPGAVIAIEHPGPTRDPGEQKPNLLSERPRQMSDTGIDADHQIHEMTERGRVGEVMERAAEMGDILSLQPKPIFVFHVFLEADERAALIEQTPKNLQIYAAIHVGFDVAAPDDADARLQSLAKPSAPCRDFPIIDIEIG